MAVRIQRLKRDALQQTGLVGKFLRKEDRSPHGHILREGRGEVLRPGQRSPVGILCRDRLGFGFHDVLEPSGRVLRFRHLRKIPRELLREVRFAPSHGKEIELALERQLVVVECRGPAQIHHADQLGTAGGIPDRSHGEIDARVQGDQDQDQKNRDRPADTGPFPHGTLLLSLL